MIGANRINPYRRHLAKIFANALDGGKLRSVLRGCKGAVSDTLHSEWRCSLTESPAIHEHARPRCHSAMSWSRLLRRPKSSRRCGNPVHRVLYEFEVEIPIQPPHRLLLTPVTTRSLSWLSLDRNRCVVLCPICSH